MQDQPIDKQAALYLKTFGIALLGMSAMAFGIAAFLKLIAGGDPIFEREFPLVMAVLGALWICMGAPLLSARKPAADRAKRRTWSIIGAIATVIAAILLISGSNVGIFETGILLAAVIGAPVSYKIGEFAAARNISLHEQAAESRRTAESAKSARSS